MEFEFTAEQEQLRKSVREFAEAEIRPHVARWDETQQFPAEAIKKAGALGLLGAIFPEDLGGAGLGYIDYAIIIEELARVDPAVGLIVAAHNSLCTNHIFIAGTEEQKRRYIPKLASGEWLGCWSLTEPEAGSDAAGTRTTAVHDANGWVINGSKTFTTNAHDAQVCVAMAVTDRAASNHGISAFIIETGWPGFRLGRKENKLGMRASSTSEVLFSDCRLPESQLLGKAGEGFVDSLRILDGGRISIAALSVGTAQGAYEAALEIFAAPQAIRPIYFGVPGHPAQAGGYGHEHRGRPPADVPRRRAQGSRPTRDEGIGHGQAISRRKWPCASATTPCRCTAATASSRTTPWRSSTATSSSAPSARGPVKYKGW